MTSSVWLESITAPAHQIAAIQSQREERRSDAISVMAASVTPWTTAGSLMQRITLSAQQAVWVGPAVAPTLGTSNATDTVQISPRRNDGRDRIRAVAGTVAAAVTATGTVTVTRHPGSCSACIRRSGGLSHRCIWTHAGAREHRHIRPQRRARLQSADGGRCPHRWPVFRPAGRLVQPGGRRLDHSSRRQRDRVRLPGTHRHRGL